MDYETRFWDNFENIYKARNKLENMVYSIENDNNEDFIDKKLEKVDNYANKLFVHNENNAYKNIGRVPSTMPMRTRFRLQPRLSRL